MVALGVGGWVAEGGIDYLVAIVSVGVRASGEGQVLCPAVSPRGCIIACIKWHGYDTGWQAPHPSFPLL